jgi:hypothetical protein
MNGAEMKRPTPQITEIIFFKEFIKKYKVF